MNLSFRVRKLENLHMADKNHHWQFTDMELAARIVYLLDQAKRVEETGIKPDGWGTHSAKIARINEILVKASNRKAQAPR